MKDRYFSDQTNFPKSLNLFKFGLDMSMWTTLAIAVNKHQAQYYGGLTFKGKKDGANLDIQKIYKI